MRSYFESQMGDERAPQSFRAVSWELSESLQRVAAEFGDAPDQAGHPDYVVRFTENIEPLGVAGVDEWFIVNATGDGVEVYGVVSSQGPLINETLTYESEWVARVQELFGQFRRTLDSS